MQDTEKVFKNYKLFLSGGARDHLWSGNMGYIGNHPNLLKIEKAEQEKIRLKKIEIAQRDQEIAQRDKLIKIEERKIKLAEQGKPDKNSLVTELCDFITSENSSKCSGTTERRDSESSPIARHQKNTSAR